MLERTTHPSGVVTYQSPLLRQIGVLHAFSTRIGGVSTGPFASLNLGNPGVELGAPQDSQDHLHENYRRLMEALACPPETRRAWVRQVHGVAVAAILPESETEYAETLDAEVRDRFQGQTAADALIARCPTAGGVLLTIRIADCVPILMASRDGAMVAAVHAGWRGVVGNIVEKTVAACRHVGLRPEDLIAAIGPGISGDHFEVGVEVAAEFVRAGLGAVVIPAHAAHAKPHINLQSAIFQQLQNAGLAPARIDQNTLCTFRDAHDFYSHRRDHGLTGRMAAVILAAKQSP